MWGVRRRLEFCVGIAGAVAMAGIGARPVSAQTVFYVDTGAPGGDGQSWATAMNDLQAALAAAGPIAAGGQAVHIWVAEGEYKPSVEFTPGQPRSRTFLIPGRVEVFGGFAGGESSLEQRNWLANETVLSGDFNGDDGPNGANMDENAFHVVRCTSVSLVAALDGFTVSGGNADGSDAYGSALRTLGTPFRLANCRVIDNQTAVPGAVVACALVGGASINNYSEVTNCRFSSGGAVEARGYIRVFDCEFLQCTGGGLGCLAQLAGPVGDAAVERCRFVQNSGRGLRLYSGGYALHCLLVQNSGGGGDAGAYSTTWSNCAFIGNTTSAGGNQANGGGLRMTGSENNNTVQRVVNCLFASNTAAGNGGGLALICENEFRRWNNVFVGNSPDNVWVQTDGCDPEVFAYNDFAYASEPAGVFVDGNGVDNLPGTLDDNYRLAPGSPLIDAITSEFSMPTPPSADLDGRPRRVDGDENGSELLDPGPYEFSPIPQTGDRYWNWPSPFGGFFTNGAAWVGGVGPGPTDTAWFDRTQSRAMLPLAYGVAFPFNADVQTHGLRVLSDTVAFQFSGFGYTVEPAVQGAGPSVVIGEYPAEPNTPFDVRLELVNATGTAGLSSSDLVIGAGPGSLGELWLNGSVASVSLGTSGDLTIGGAGDGEVQCTGSSLCAVTGSVALARDAGSRGALVLDGPGVVLEHEGVSVAALSHLVVGGGGHGAIEVLEGAGLIGQSFTGGVVIADGPGSSADVSLQSGTAAASVWNAAGPGFVLGNEGAAALAIEGNARLETATLPPGPVLAETPAASAILAVVGPDALWLESISPITIGAGGNAAVTLVDGGTIEAPAINFHFRGLIRGSGTLRGLVRNIGAILAPGSSESSGDIEIDGDYRQFGAPGPVGATGGRLVLGLHGPTPGERSTIHVTGEAELSGGIYVDLRNDYEPETTDPPTELLSAAAVIDQFDVAYFPGFAPDPKGNIKVMRLMYGAGGSPEGGAAVSVFVTELENLINLDDPPPGAPVTGLPQGAAAADFDGDGFDDLAISVPSDPPGSNGEVIVLLNSGQFTCGTGGDQWCGFSQQATITVQVGPAGLAVGDFTGDNRPDIAVANSGSDSVSVITNNSTVGTPMFNVTQTVAVGDEPVALDAGPLNTDGSVDLIVANRASDDLSLLTNSGVGVFTNAATIAAGDSPTDVRVARFEGDGDLDPDLDFIVVNGGDGTAGFYFNDGNAAFDPPILVDVGLIGALVVQPGDLDNNKDDLEEIDVVIGDAEDGEASVILNNGDGTFQPAVVLDVGGGIGSLQGSLALADLDGDGDLDITTIVENDQNERVIRILRNDYDPMTQQLAFAPFVDQGAGTNPLLVVAGDVDGDAEQDDIFAVNEGSLAPPEAGAPRESEATALVSLGAKKPLPCPGDLDGNNQVNTTDLNILLSDFGCTAAPCPGDADGDGDTDTTDLNILLSAFGAPC